MEKDTRTQSDVSRSVNKKQSHKQHRICKNNRHYSALIQAQGQIAPALPINFAADLAAGRNNRNAASTFLNENDTGNRHQKHQQQTYYTAYNVRVSALSPFNSLS